MRRIFRRALVERVVEGDARARWGRVATPNGQPGRDVDVASSGAARAWASASDASADVLRLVELTHGIRARGHLTAALDPLGRSLGPITRGFETMEATTPVDARDIHALVAGYPNLLYVNGERVGLERYLGLSDASPDREFYLGEDAATLDPSGRRAKTMWRASELFERLRDVYCGTMSVESNHLTSKERKRWLREQVESGPVKANEKTRRKTLTRLLRAGKLEKFLAEKFPSAKRFGLEGAESLIPGLQAFVERAAERGVEDIVLGMAHRGRLNVLHNVFSKPLGAISAEIVDDRSSFLVGDVRYHLGARALVDVDVRDGVKRPVKMTLVPNPSHLEMVNAVVSGVVRAKQFRLEPDTQGARARSRVLPLLLHGDASFCGLGQNGEVMQLQDLPDYTTGGTVHVIVNNQIGFTTVPRRARSSPHPSDVAKAYGAPIVHVNGDDPDAVIRAMKLAADYRAEFLSDVVVNFVCYRRFGHNELDDPSITLPLMSRRIAATPRIAETYANACVADGTITNEELKGLKEGMEKEFAADSATHQEFIPTAESWLASTHSTSGIFGREALVTASGTGMPIDALKAICHSITTPPADKDFELHPYVEEMFQARRRSMEPAAQVGTGQIDWATAEALAFASLLLHPDLKRWGKHSAWWMDAAHKKPIGSHAHIRLSGQDCVRGTFNHRHAAIYCNRTSHDHVPLDNMGLGTQDRFIAANSPLSEHAVLGFEYGFSVEIGKEALVIWEAQFGDFANNAQVIIDQFICSGEERWGQRSNMVLLLPHGYEGQGPDHSSARPERWLAAANDDPDALPGNAASDLALAERTFNALGPDDKDFVDLKNIRKILHPDVDNVENRAKTKSFGKALATSDEHDASGMWEDIEAYFGSNGKIHRRDWIRYMRRRARASFMTRANFVMVQPSTPAQYFHVLRRQMSSPYTKPLIVLTPKTLLHHKYCASKLQDFAPKSSFRRVIADGDAGDDVTRHETIPLKPDHEIKRVALCTGKIYYQLARQRLAKKIDDVAIVRLEQLFPFPHDALARRLQRYPNAHVVWVQEEPKNMGYWSYVAPRIATTERATRARASSEHDRLRYVGRPPAASAATGSFAIHTAESASIINQALDASEFRSA